MRFSFRALCLAAALVVLTPLVSHAAEILASGPISLRALGGAEVWHRIEFTIENGPQTANNFDPDLVQIDAVFTAPSGRVTRVPAFWFQDFSRNGSSAQTVYTPGAQSWRVRFTPTEVGDYSVALAVQVGDHALAAAADLPVATVAPTRFSVAAGAQPIIQHWAQNAPDGRSFETSDHQPLRLVGENICWSVGRGIDDFDTWFGELKKVRGNFARVWLCPWSLGIEHVPGSLTHYRQAEAWQLDQVFFQAERDGIYLLLCLDHHGMFQVENSNWDNGNNFWKTNPYSQLQGGPCVTPNDFFTNAQAQAIYRKRLRYLIGRYGYSPALLSWEFFNEIDNVYAPQQSLVAADVANWHRTMGQWLHAHDPYHHLVSTSLTGGSDRAEIWSLPEIDFAMYHSYGDPAPARLLATLTQDFNQRYHKPVLIGEFGISPGSWDLQEDPHLRGFRQLLWGGALGGSVGTGMSWWWDSVHDEHVYPIFQTLTDVMSHAGWSKGSWSAIDFDSDAKAISNDLGAALPDSLPFGATVALSSYRRATISDEVTIANALSAERAGEQVSSFLLGTVDGPRHQPIKLTARFTALGKVSFRVNSVASDVELVVTVDGTEKIRTRIFDRDGKAAVNHEIDRPFAVEIPAGIHTIQILNTGTDWAALEALQVEGVQPSAFADGHAFRAEKIGIADGERRRAAIYVHSPWIAYPAGAYRYQPPLILDETITLPQWAAGKVEVKCFDAEKGTIISRDEGEPANGSLLLHLPPFREDVAVVVTPVKSD